MVSLAAPATEFTASKIKFLEALLKVDHPSVGDLLRHYPRRLVRRDEPTDLSSLRVGDDVTVVAVVHRCEIKGNRRMPRTLRLEVVVGDGTAHLQLAFFGQRSLWRERELVVGTIGLFAGRVGEFRGRLQLVHPQYELLGPTRGEDELGRQAVLGGSEPSSRFASGMIAIYPASKHLQSWQIADTIHAALIALDPVVDPLPESARARHKLADLDTAIRTIHEPANQMQWYVARHRLAWDEALGIQLALAQRRAMTAQDPATARPPISGGLADAFDARLPFQLTASQLEIGQDLSAELGRAHPMHRLLQGEVGSGKTVVALRAMLQVVDAGGQAALLAPTEVLAAQHARSIQSMLGELAQAGQLGSSDVGTRVALLTGSLPAAARKRALLEAASGAAGIVIGTHALIQDQVQFADLGLVVVDEQHRFGVEQRDALRGKAAKPPHVLVMTATPIPRTVAMTVFGDLEISTLQELPLGRAGITSSVVPAAEKPAWLERTWQRVREEVAAGHQIYIVCPRIGDGGAEIDVVDDPDLDDADDDDSDADTGDGDTAGVTIRKPAPRPARAVLDVAAELVDGPLAGLRVATMHGRLPAEEKDAVMQAFSAGAIDVMVATTVIEVGVDVANATVMVIFDADRFGVSQLHQLRGRVGRGSAPGLCLLVTEAPASSPARERLTSIAATNDGFELARLDVEQRREGDILGASQSGSRRQLRLLSLQRDENLIAQAREEAIELIANDPHLARHPGLAAMVAGLVAAEQAEFLEKG
jgi:ATP-dependent DNA helicase RecG